MANKKTAFLKITAIIFLCTLLMSFLPSCTDSGETSQTESLSSEKVQYIVEVKTQGGMVLEDIGVFVYRSAESDDLVWAGNTDKDGKVSFQADDSKDYVAVLKDVPEGYDIADNYNLSAKNSVISLETTLVSTTDFSDVTFGLGSIIHDFSIKSADGKEYKISQLLNEKKAIVLNFWFLNCGPCKTEFPYMQQAYSEYTDKIEILALNPVDGTDETISAFADDLNLTMPMAVCDSGLEQAFKLTAYPTTVIIDRYGMIAMMHKGSITDKETFTEIFEYFTADDYQQSTVRNISDIK